MTHCGSETERSPPCARRVRSSGRRRSRGLHGLPPSGPQMLHDLLVPLREEEVTVQVLDRVSVAADVPDGVPVDPVGVETVVDSGQESLGHALGDAHGEAGIAEARGDVELVASPRGGGHPELGRSGTQIEKFRKPASLRDVVGLVDHDEVGPVPVSGGGERGLDGRDDHSSRFLGLSSPVRSAGGDGLRCAATAPSRAVRPQVSRMCATTRTFAWGCDTRRFPMTSPPTTVLPRPVARTRRAEPSAARSRSMARTASAWYGLSSYGLGTRSGMRSPMVWSAAPCQSAMSTPIPARSRRRARPWR